MERTFPHLPLVREAPVTEKRPGGAPRFKAPEDPAAHARGLQSRLDATIQQTAGDEGGFDERRLFRFTVEKGFDPESLRHISHEIEFVSQEQDEVVVAFVTSAALESFEARLSSMVKGEKVKYKQVLYAIKGMDGWSKQDRQGWALRNQGVPDEAPFVLDLELWPLEDQQDKRARLWEAFEQWLDESGINRLDSVKNAGLSLYRVQCDHGQTERLLRHRDVRTVDLPPRFGLDVHLLRADIQDIPPPPPPPENAPGITVLDSGLTTGHPLIAPAVGDAQSFLPGKDASDEHGHGTHVAGISLYDDVALCLQNKGFVPAFRIFSGRILDENNENSSGFVENHIDKAVRYFHNEYGCRIFNLSFGDRNKPYLGGHVKGLAYTLDVLSRELGVLFVVSAGNVLGSQLEGLEWRERYPGCLSEDDWAIVDPATALNVITVGSLARYDQSFNSQRWKDDPAEVPIARRDQPSPFTRHGPTVGDALKPDLMAYGGNWAVNTRAGANLLVPSSGLGELSTCMRFAAGELFAEESGTSMAAPHVAHLAAALLAEYPEADTNLVRALLLAHASIPEASQTLFEGSAELRRVCGYGSVDSNALFRSLENDVSLFASGDIANKTHHFYSIPIPDEYVSNGRRLRELTIAMAYTPYVRSTRISYKSTRIDFKVVAASDLESVTTMFNRATDREDYENIQELKNPDMGGRLRGKGTAQAATWRFFQFGGNSILRKNRLFVVVTRNDHSWGEPHSAAEESYALAVCLRDRSNQQARLYTELRNRLQARARVRTK